MKYKDMTDPQIFHAVAQQVLDEETSYGYCDALHALRDRLVSLREELRLSKAREVIALEARCPCKEHLCACGCITHCWAAKEQIEVEDKLHKLKELISKLSLDSSNKDLWDLINKEMEEDEK